MKYEVVTLNEMQVVGIAVRASNCEEGAKSIGSTWQRFFAEKVYDTIDNKVSGLGIGLYTEYDTDATGSYTFLCGCEVSKNNNPNLDSKIINAGKYAKFVFKGDPVNSVMQAWQEIWAMDLNRKYECDFEVYHNDSADMNNQTIEIFISLND